MKVAILGVWHVHAQDYLRQSRAAGAEVLGAWDPDEKMLSDFCARYEVPKFTSREELLASEAEGVICCSSTDRHVEDIVAIAGAKKNIFTEKVLAITTEACETIEKAVKDNGVKFVISLVQKYTSAPRTIKALVEDGKLGKINYLRFRNCHNGSTGNWLPEHFFRLSQCGGGAMIDLGAHGMYLIDWFLGLPESGKSVFTIWDENPRNVDKLEDNAVTVLSYPCGCIAVNETGFDSVGAPMRLEVGGRNGYAVYENDKVTFSDGKETVEVEQLPALPAPIVQFVTGNILPGCGMEEAKHLTKLMEIAYQNR